MKSLVFVLASLAVSAQAAISDYTGIYKVDTCAISELGAAKKVYISEQGKLLVLRGYGAQFAQDLTVQLGSGTQPASGTDGTVSWNTVEAGGMLTSDFKFERLGSSTWPDLVYMTNLTLTKNGTALHITHSSKTTVGPGSNSVEECDLTSTEGDVSQIQFSPLAKPSNLELEALTRANLAAHMDLDQASLDIKAVKVGTFANNKQISEVLSVEVLPQFADVLRLKTISGDSKAIAEKAFDTVISIARDRIHDGASTSEYQTLFDYVDRVAAFIEANKANFKILHVEWSESDSDGEGLFIIDEASGEALYIGSSYFS